MAKQRSAFRAGLLMLISLGLIAFVIVSIKGTAWLRPAAVHLVAFDLKTNLSGLRIGDEVRIGGFKVGEVKHITLRTTGNEPSRPPHILVAFTVPREHIIRQDAKVRIDGTLTGTSWLNFEDLGRGEPLKPGAVLVGGPSPMSELLAKAEGLAPQLNEILTDVRQKTVPLVNQTVEKYGKVADSFKQTGDNTAALTGDMRNSFKGIVEKYHAMGDKAIVMMDTVREVFSDTKDDFRTTMANLRKATTSVSEKLPGILDKVDAAMVKVNTAIDSVNKSLAELHTTVLNARDMTGSAKTLVVGNKSKLDGMIDSAKKAGDNLKAATAEIRRSPWRLLYKPQPGEVSNLNVYDSARQFAEGANDLNDAASALRDAVKSGDRKDEQLKPLMEKLDKSFANFKEVEEKLWSSVKD